MNFKIVVSSEGKKNLVWHWFDNCDEDLKIINLILLIEVFDYSTSLIQVFWWSFQLVYSFFIKNLTARRNIWFFDQDSDLILNEGLILIIHHHFSVSLVDRFHSLSIEFEFMFELQCDKSLQHRTVIFSTWSSDLLEWNFIRLCSQQFSSWCLCS